jgi:sec-independent protein translocase protein TatB
MFDLGWQELFVIGTVTLIVVGPKDLPKLLNRAGKTFGKIKKISREFYDQINETAEIEEINNLKNDLSETGTFLLSFFIACNNHFIIKYVERL